MGTFKFDNNSDDKSVLLIEANRLGSVKEIISFLGDIENAYKGILRFNAIADRVINSINLLPIDQLMEIDITEEGLILSRICIQSPGFWEFIGSLNPLEQIRKYVNDCYERQKEKEYRGLDKERKELEIIKLQNSIFWEKIKLLKSIGYSEQEIRVLLEKLIILPLEKLITHQNSGLIMKAKINDDRNTNEAATTKPIK